MKTLFNSFICLLAFTFHAGAQTAQDSVKLAINSMFKAMVNADAVSLRKCFADSAVLQTVVSTKDGKVTVRNEPIPDFIEFISKQVAGDADERLVFDLVKIDANLATVWAPYKFYYKGKFSHCGVDAFALVRINNVWKVQYIIDTRRESPCE